MSDDVWTDAEVRALHQQIRGELQSIFGHDETIAHSLLTDWLSSNSRFSADDISHQGPFNMALRIHYALVEGGDPADVEFTEWHKQYHVVWDDRYKPTLTSEQEALLRERGWNGS